MNRLHPVKNRFKYRYQMLIVLFVHWFGLVSWVLWHINLYKLFNAKSIFM